MRLIDADALIKFIDCGHYRSPIELCFSEKDVVDIINKQPTAQQVRCKDCRHNNNCDIQYASQSGDEFFCALAEKREI